MIRKCCVLREYEVTVEKLENKTAISKEWWIVYT
jgi:hypothetical protein